MSRRLRAKLSSIVPAEELEATCNSFDIIGEIAIVKLQKKNIKNAEKIANEIIVSHKNVKTVFAQTGPISTDFRVRDLKLLCGKNKTDTIYKESGCEFAVDVSKCYFSPRLSHERSRIAKLVKQGETIVNMFAGVGCFSILIGKSVPKSKVFSIDINPIAVRYMVENIRINRVYGKVRPLIGDSKEIIQGQLQGKADRVLMPLPEKAFEYLPYALLALRARQGMIHFYDFQHSAGAENPVDKTEKLVEEKLRSLCVNFVFEDSRIVRSTGPNWYQTVLDIRII